MKTLTRVPIFNYSTIATTLLLTSKSLEIKFRKKFLTAETIFELESILAWSASHTEVQSLLITSVGDDFIQGFEAEELKKLTPTKLKKLFQKLHTIAESFQCLPQTIVVDLKKGTKGIGLELALAADIRICHDEALFCFDQLSMGITPSCGIFSFQKNNLNQNVLRSLLLSGIEFSKESLIALGGWCESNTSAERILANIFKQAPIARIQAKKALYGLRDAKNNEELKNEKKIFNSVIESRDYTRNEDFMSLNEFKNSFVEINN
jgi:enoyl-CoA hydratase/carnithine racemase